MKINEWTGLVVVLTLLVGTATYNVTINEDDVTVEWTDSLSDCSSLQLIVEKTDTNRLKCGRYIIAEWDTIVLNERHNYLETSWEQNNRNIATIKQWVEEQTPDYFIVNKQTTYNRGSTSSYDGKLIESYRFDKKGLKWSYSYDPSSSAENYGHYIVLRMKRDLTEQYGFKFFPKDDQLKFEKDNEYYYGGTKGNLFVDPTIMVNGMTYTWNYDCDMTELSRNCIEYQTNVTTHNRTNTYYNYSMWNVSECIDCDYTCSEVNLTCEETIPYNVTTYWNTSVTGCIDWNVTEVCYPKNRHGINITISPPNQERYVSFDGMTGSMDYPILTLKSLERGGSWNDRDLNSCYNLGVPCRQLNISDTEDWQIVQDIEDSDGVYINVE